MTLGESSGLFHLREVYEQVTPHGVGERLIIERLKGHVDERDVMKLLYFLIEGRLIWCPVPHVYCRWDGSE